MEGRFGSDLLGRLTQFFATGGAVGVVAVGVILFLLLYLTVAGKRLALVSLFMIAVVFSGFVVAPAMDSGSTLFRWVVIFLLAATVGWGMRWAGPLAFVLFVLGAAAIVMSFSGRIWFYAAQRSFLLMVFAGPMAWALADSLNSKADVDKFYKTFMIAAAVYVVAAVANMGHMVPGRRFGGGQGAPLFVMTGGMLLPVVLWGAFQVRLGWWRRYCALTVIALFALLALSGQRTGTIAGVIGCLPILTRIQVRKLLVGAAIVTVIAAVVAGLFLMLPERAEFVEKRFFTTEMSGRWEIWRVAWQACMRHPFWGEGIGSSFMAVPAHVTPGQGFFGGGSVHSAYLAAWYDVGLIGLVLYVGASVFSAFQAFRLMRYRSDSEIADMGRLLLGLILASVASGVGEETVWSPSSLPAFALLTVSIVASRLSHLVKAEQAGARALEPLSAAAAPEWPAQALAEGVRRL